MAIFFLAVAVVIGFLLVRLANPADKLEPRWAAFLLKLTLGSGGGIALVSLLFLLLLMLHAASPLVMLPIEAVLLLSAAGLVFIRRRRTGQDPFRGQPVLVVLDSQRSAGGERAGGNRGDCEIG